MATKVVLPHLGESVDSGIVECWLKDEGSWLEKSEPLLEVNTDKVNVEIPSPAAGTLLQICVTEGESVSVGAVLAWIGDAGEVVPAAPETTVNADAGAREEVTAADEIATGPQPANVSTMEQVQEISAPATTFTPHRSIGFISPAVSRLLQEHDFDLSRVRGTGHNGRVTRKDVVDYLERQPSAPAHNARARSPVPQQVKAHNEELVPHTSMRRAIANHMVHSKQSTPHVTTVMEADLTRVVEHRRVHKETVARQGVRLTYTAYVIAATAHALANHPFANASWRDDGILLHEQIHIGMATSLDDNGLLVPVIRNTGDYSLIELARIINDLAARARSARLAPDEVAGGTFTITNYGVNGPLFGTPIINQPQSAILGIGLIHKRAVVIDEAIAIRPMVYLSLTFDHRVLDGASADAFLLEVVSNLEQWS